MTVFILTGWDEHRDTSILGVFATEAEANRRAKTLASGCVQWEVSSWSVLG
jgi:hypothetical protein